MHAKKTVDDGSGGDGATIDICEYRDGMGGVVEVPLGHIAFTSPLRDGRRPWDLYNKNGDKVVEGTVNPTDDRSLKDIALELWQAARTQGLV